MTTRADILREIQEMLGSNGSPELANRMLAEFEDSAWIEFDHNGYFWSDSFHSLDHDQQEAVWNRALASILGPGRQ